MLFLAAVDPSLGAAQGATPAIPTMDEEFVPMLLMLDINQQGLDETALMLQDRRGALYASVQDLRRWRLRLPAVPPVNFEGVPYYPLAALAGIKTQLNEATQTLSISVKPEAFATTTAMAHPNNYSPPIRPSPGMFFNYDVFVERSNSGGTAESGLFEVAAFNALGTAVTSFTRQSGNGPGRSVRLDTTFTLDRPELAASFRFGDAVSRGAGMWGNSVHFGGLQYASNFATQPGFITAPMQNFIGQAALPSTVDVYVNNMLTTQKNVPPGPFSITSLPVVNGQGNVRMVVRDVLGREQVITQFFYTNATLLRPGLQDFSFELGAVRDDFGIRSNAYGRRFAAGTYRRGLSDNLTAEGHMEMQSGARSTFGLGATALLPSLGGLHGAVAGSRSDAGNGRLWALGFERQTAMFNFGARTQLASENFLQLGSESEPGLPTPRRLTSANIGLVAGQSGSIGMAYVAQSATAGDPVKVASISYSRSLNRYGYLGISASKTLSGQSNRTISINWSMPLGDNLNLNVSTNTSSNRQRQTEAQVQRNLLDGDGYGYRLQASDNGPQQATLLLQNNVGSYALETASFQAQTRVRAGISGGVALLGGAAFFSRRISDSFGLVQLPGMENVRVYVDNQPAGRTDANGNALLPRLRPYDNNPVRVEQLDLGLDTEIRSLTMNPVPYYRSGVVIRFPIVRSHGAMLRLVSDDGKDLPAGTLVAVAGQDTQFPVAMDGAVYVTGLTEVNRMHALWQGKRCALTVPFRTSSDPLPHLGTFVCRAVK
jgi:outer membrane usher protein